MASVCDLVTDVTLVTAAEKPARYFPFRAAGPDASPAEKEPIG